MGGWVSRAREWFCVPGTDGWGPVDCAVGQQSCQPDLTSLIGQPAATRWTTSSLLLWQARRCRSSAALCSSSTRGEAVAAVSRGAAAPGRLLLTRPLALVPCSAGAVPMLLALCAAKDRAGSAACSWQARSAPATGGSKCSSCGERPPTREEVPSATCSPRSDMLCSNNVRRDITWLRGAGGAARQAAGWRCAGRQRLAGSAAPPTKDLAAMGRD